MSLRRLLVSVLVLIAFAATSARAGDAVDAVFRTAEGERVSLSDFRGRHVLVEFWATWCLPCRVDMPKLERLAARLEAKGLTVVPISIDRLGRPAVERFYREVGLTRLPIYLDQDREAVAALGIEYVPAALLLDPDGRVVRRWDKGPDWDEAGAEVEAAIKSR